MLVELALADLALFERAGLTLGPGLNAITGETGAGKSLVVDALELLLGARARSGLVRAGAARARVEGRFLLSPEGPRGGYGERVAGWLEECLPETLEEWREEAGEGERELELVLSRTVGRDGKSRAHVNHRPVTQRLLRELASLLVEIHGQNDHQTLFDPAEQRRLVDGFGGLEAALAGYRERRARWLEGAERLARFEADEAERLQRLDLVRFQAHELQAAGPTLDEAADLAREREVLRHASELALELGGLLDALAERDDAALDALQRAERALERWGERIEALAAPAAAVREAAAQLEEAVGELRSFVDGVDADPARLEDVEARLGELERLQRKHGTDAAGLAARRAALEAELAALEGAVADRGELERAVAKAREGAEQAARRLSGARAKLAPKLVAAVEKGLADLGLDRARFAVELPAAEAEGQGLEAERRRLGPHGRESVEFSLAANPGEPAQPLRQVASGGEAARVMLALRGALAVRQSTPTLVFDEVDAGVGGRLGPRVGAHLAALARHHQVLCVTHLPAIAALADRHLRVTKAVAKGRTRTSLERLAGDARVEEIAAMIAGASDAETARAEARRLLEGV